MNEPSNEYQKRLHVEYQKLLLIEELSRYPFYEVSALLKHLTGREDLSTANLFCLALMANALRRKFTKFSLTDS